MDNQITTVDEANEVDEDDYYAVLGVPNDATQSEIKKAYKRLAAKHHPDRKGGNKDLFVLVKEAYEVLSDPDTRNHYDEYGRFDPEQVGFAKQMIESIVETIITGSSTLETHDIVSELRSKIANNMNGAKRKKDKEVRKIRKFKRNIDRTKDEVIRTVFNKRIGLAEEEIKTINKDIAIFEIAAVLSRKLAYDFDQQRRHPNSFPSSSGVWLP